MNALHFFASVSALFAVLQFCEDEQFLPPLIGALVFFVAAEFWSNLK